MENARALCSYSQELFAQIDKQEQPVHKSIMEKKEKCQIDELTFAFLDSKLPPVNEKGDRRSKLKAIAVRIGLSEKQLIDFDSGKRNLGTKSAEKLAAIYHLTHLEMLVAGQKILDRDESDVKSHKVSLPQLTIDFPAKLRKYADSHPMSKEHYVPVRIIKGSAAAGSPLEVDETETDGWALIYASKDWMPNAPEHYSCVHVSGRSMWPILSDGDIVAIDHAQRDPRELDGKMVAFRVNGGVTIKWLKYDANRKVLVGIPENTEELDHIVTLKGAEIDDGIVGKVAWWWAKR